MLRKPGSTRVASGKATDNKLTTPRFEKDTRQRSTLWRYGLAISMTIATLGVCLTFSWIWKTPASPVAFLIPIVLSAYFGGLRPGLLATALSVVLADYFLIEPVRTLAVESPADAFRLVALLLAGVIASVALESLHRARAKAIYELGARKRTETKLAESELNYRSLFEHMVDALAYCRLVRDKQGHIDDFIYLDVNPSFAQATGMKFEEVVGKRLTEVFPDVKQSHPDLLRLYDRVAHTGQPEKFEINFDPLQSWFSVSVYSLDREHIVIVFQNITKSKRAEQAIRQSEAELTAIYDNVPLTILLVDCDNRICKANKFVDGALGASAGPIGQRTGDALQCVRSLHSPDGCGSGPNCKVCTLRRIVLETMATGRSFQNVEVHLPSVVDGRTQNLFLLVSTAKLEIDRQPRVLITLQDITERKKAEAELQHQFKLMRCITDQSADSILLTDRQGLVTFVNPETEKVFGFTAEELMGRVFHDMIHHHHPDGREYPASECRMATGLHTGETFRHHEEVFFRKDGTMADVSVSTSLLEVDGERLGTVFVLQDITERKQEALAKLRSQKLEALGTIAGGIAHDFNNILAAINGNARLAMSELQDGHSIQECLTEITKAGVRGAQLVQRILTFGRPVEQERDVQRIEDVVDEALKLVRATLPSAIEIRTDFARDLLAARVDSSQIHQVIVNLATNAAHAIGDKPGRIEVGITNRHLSSEDLPPALQLREGRYVRIQFSDDGCGMAAAVRERIFDPFFTTKPVGQGTGLGLSIVHGIITKHGGAITVYSEPGRGTAFHIYLPAVEKTAEPAKGAPAEAQVATNLRVLFVDDDEALVYLYARKLKRLGYEVRGLSDPRAAVQEFRSAPDAFDVVITDVSMPHMSGFDLARELLAVRANIPIIVTSGYVRPDDEAKKEQLGIQEIIPKPWAEERLTRALNQALALRATAEGC